MQKKHFFLTSGTHKMKQICSGFCMIPKVMPLETNEHRTGSKVTLLYQFEA
jgi:hypothetical protein